MVASKTAGPHAARAEVTARHRFEYWGLRLAGWVVRLLPLPWLVKASKPLGSLVFSCDSRGRHVCRQNLDAVLKRLERDGLVERVINEQDRRAKIVALTTEGFQTWDSLQDDFFEFYGQALNKLAFDDVITLIHLLNKVNDGLKSIHLQKESDQ